jgi:hypothetical protein
MALTKDQLENLKKVKKIFLANMKMTYKNIGSLEGRIKKFIFDADLKNKLLNRAAALKLKYLTMEKEINTFSSVNKLAGADPNTQSMIVITYDQANSIFSGFNARLVGLDNETKGINADIDSFLSGKINSNDLLTGTAKQYTDISRSKAVAGNITTPVKVQGTIPGGVVGAGGGAGRSPVPIDWKKFLVPALVVGGVILAWPLIKPMVSKLLPKKKSNLELQ